ncbi:MAG: YczE/YyaS/YitT family protein [Cellulosilyticaceae bacterium]
MNTTMKKMLLMFIGIVLIGIGIAIFVKSGLGSEPFTVMTLAMSEKLGMSLTLFQGGFNVVILIAVLLVDKSKVYIGTLANMFLIAPIIELCTPVLEQIMPGQQGLIVNLILMAVGCLIIAVGVGAYLGADVGLAPYDIIGVVISEKTKVPYKWVRMATDAICVTVGLMVGGIVGLSTVCAVLLLGPLAGYFKAKTEEYLLEAQGDIIS